jgi:chromosome partitioning protein
MPLIVAFLNFKGGVGKTTNVVNIAGCLAATHGKRVLGVDLDPQCNASLWLLGAFAYRGHAEGGARTVVQAFRDRILGTRRFRLEEAVAHGVPRSRNGFYLIENLDLLPGSVELLEVEDQLLRWARMDSHRILHDELAPHLDQYDYVLLDCAPNFLSMTKNAVFLAQHLVVPCILDYLSLTGFHALSSLVAGFGKRVGRLKASGGGSRISAVTVNRFQAVGNVYQQGLLELENLMGDLRGAGLIHPDAKVLEPMVRSCVKVAEAPALHLPIVLHDPHQRSNGAIDYAALTQDFMRHLQEIS